MITEFSQHRNDKKRLRDPLPRPGVSRVSCLPDPVGLQKIAVHVVLLRRDITKQNLFLLGRETNYFLHLGLRATHEEGQRFFAQNGGGLEGRFHHPWRGVHVTTGFDRLGKHLFERRKRAEQTWLHEVEYAPEFRETILDRGAGQHQPVRRVDALAALGDTRVRIADL